MGVSQKVLKLSSKEMIVQSTLKDISSVHIEQQQFKVYDI